MIRACYLEAMPRPLLALFLALALPAAADVTTIANMVHAERVDPAPLVEGLRASDALSRATAARVALVRNVAAVVPVLREVLAKETNHDAAREELRALVLLGSDEDVAFTVQQLPRYPESIDAELGDAIARIGGTRALDLYFRHVSSKLRMPAFAALALVWDNEALIPVAASRALGAGDFAFFEALLDPRPIDSALAIAALGHESPDVRVTTLWHLVQHAEEQPALIAAVRDAVQPREGAAIEEAFARELVRRAAGATPREVAGAAAWIGDEKNRLHLTRIAVERLMTPRERAQRAKPKEPIFTTPAGNPHTMEVQAPPFTLPIALPAGLGDALLRGCRGGWIGVAPVTVDRSGRVTGIDTANLSGEPPCLDALRTAARLSLARIETISPSRTAQLIFLRDRSQSACFDEDPLVNAPAAATAQRIGNGIRAPKVTRRVEPEFPQTVLSQLASGESIPVLIETIISSTGCLRSYRLVRQSKYPELNRSALEALSKWKFEPGALDGVPVDVIFYLTINFKSR